MSEGSERIGKSASGDRMGNYECYILSFCWEMIK